jgi:hypothetical protein
VEAAFQRAKAAVQKQTLSQFRDTPNLAQYAQAPPPFLRTLSPRSSERHHSARAGGRMLILLPSSCLLTPHE